MASRTYIPQLRFVLKIVDRYTKRWQTQLQENLTEGQYTCLLAVIDAVTECLVALGTPDLNP
jgi:hypothetical protein